MSKCDCIKKLEEKVSQVKNIPLEDVSFKEINLLTGISYNKIQYEEPYGKTRKVKREMYVQHSFCPFCGVSLTEKKEG